MNKASRSKAKSRHGDQEVQQAILNILEDFGQDKELMENSQKAMLNILEDSAGEKKALEEMQYAVINVLEDFNHEKDVIENSQRAVMNILEDANSETQKLRNTEKAILNILEDYDKEQEKINIINKKLEEGRDQLEIRVEERTQELKKSNEELESFSYSVSHDLRAPLRAINGYSSILLEDYYHKLDEAGRDTIKTIARNASKMALLIDDILSFSRLGRQEMVMQRINMSELFKGVFKELKQNVSHRKIKFTLGNLKEAKGDKTMITQLVTNLLSNAIKYTGPRQLAEIRVRGQVDEGHYVYSVTDNGVGFNMKYNDKLFGVFQRLHKEREFEGTGVGLAISQRVINHHKGSIWAESEIDKGSTFYFTINESKTAANMPVNQ